MEWAGDPDDAESGGGGAVGDVSRGSAGGVGDGEGLWTRGWRVGRRIAIAGAVISSAPVLVPLLLLLSAVGLAFALPFGVFFAGYACTDKIMRSLLPLPVHSPGAPPPEGEEQENEEREEERGEEEDGEVRAAEAEKGLKGMETTEEEVKVVEEEPFGVREEEGEGKLSRGIEAVEEEEEKEEEEGLAAFAGSDEGRISAVGEEEKPVEERGFDGEKQVPVTVSAHGEELLGEDKGAEDQGQVTEEEEKPAEEGVAPLDMGEESDRGAVEDKRQVQAVMEKGAIADEESTFPLEVEEKHVDEKEIEEVRDQNDEGLIPVERLEKGSVAAAGGEETADASPAVVAVSVVEREVIIEPPGPNPGGTSAVEEQLSDAADAESAGSVEHPAVQGGPCAAHAPQNSDEGWCRHEMWEQIDAIRAILGYRGPRRSSCMGELKTLYLFVGVEPPTSLEGSCSREDVEDKLLRFLKSIIGVE